MKIFVNALPFLLAALLVPGILCAADLDTYYLQRFGELNTGSSPVAGVAQVSADLPFDRCGTPLVRGLRQDWGKLATGTQQVLAKYLAKPALYGEAQVLSAGEHFLIHYATGGSDAPPPADVSPSNGIPDWVETVASVFEAVYRREVVEMGYTPAPTVGGQPYDVYLQNLGRTYLGMTNSGSFVTSSKSTSYIVIDNDFAEFVSRDSGTGYYSDQYLAITAAHEYHHAIQYGYNFYFEIWYAEATSTWMEDEVFDSVNQLYDYLPGWFSNFDLPLNEPVNVYTGGGYGRWLFNRYIAEISGVDSIRLIWQQLSETTPPINASYAYEINTLPIIDGVLGGRLSEFVLGLGKRMVLGNWVSHTKDINLIHPVLTTAGLTVIQLATYPSNQYSYVFLDYPLSQLYSVNLGLKPATVAALPLETSISGIYVLSNNLTGATTTPSDPQTRSEGVTDALQLALKSNVLETNPSSPSSGGGGGGCFIATAAYGSYLHPKVMVLREFRDRWLLTNPVGRILVDSYYRVSPSVAAVIARHEWLRRVARGLLSPIIAMVEHPECFASLAVGLLGWLLLRRRVTA